MFSSVVDASNVLLISPPIFRLPRARRYLLTSSTKSSIFEGMKSSVIVAAFEAKVKFND